MSRQGVVAAVSDVPAGTPPAPRPAPPAPPARTERRRLATRQSLIAAALWLFAERGYDGTTMDMVADRADLARTTVFNHFPRKDALLLAALADRRAIVGDRLAQTRDGRLGTGDRIRDAIGQWAAAYQSDARTGAALVRAWVRAGGPYLPGATDTARLFATALAAGQEQGDVRSNADADLGGLVLLDSTVGALVRWATEPATTEPATTEPATTEPATTEQAWPLLNLRSAMLGAADIVLRGLLTDPAPAPD
jgi:AcrR family transcriptional regulator